VVHLSLEDFDQTYVRLTTGSTVPREDYEELCLVPLEQAVHGTAWTLILVDGPGEYHDPRWKTHAQWMLISMEKNSSVALSFMKHSEYLTGSIWRPLPDGTWTVFYLSPTSSVPRGQPVPSSAALTALSVPAPVPSSTSTTCASTPPVPWSR